MFFKDGKFSIEQSWGEKGKPKSINDLGSDKLLNNEKQKRKESNDKMLDILDDEVAKRILKDFKEEGGYKSLTCFISNMLNLFRKRKLCYSDERTSSTPKTLSYIIVRYKLLLVINLFYIKVMIYLHRWQAG